MTGHDFAAMREQLRTGKAVQVAVAPQLFPTPPHVAAQLVDKFASWAGEAWETMRVLEPSAGTGNLIEALFEEWPGADLVAWEINQALADALRAKYAPHLVMNGDFLLSAQCLPGYMFDAVIMNPPYERGVWFDHVRHAFAQLKRGGRLAAVLPQSPQLDRLLKLVPLYARQDLPDNTFAGTAVRTCIVTMDKPE